MISLSVGLLEETERDRRKTVEFAESLAVDSIQVSIATPYPGTKFYTILQEEGLLKNTFWRNMMVKVQQLLILQI